MANSTCLGVIVGNRDFFPDVLISEARKDLTKLFSELRSNRFGCRRKSRSWARWKPGRTRKSAANCCARHRDRIEGILVCLPNFGDEKGVADSIRLAETHVPVLVQACPTISISSVSTGGATLSAARFRSAITCASTAFPIRLRAITRWRFSIRASVKTSSIYSNMQGGARTEPRAHRRGWRAAQRIQHHALQRKTLRSQRHYGEHHRSF